MGAEQKKSSFLVSILDLFLKLNFIKFSQTNFRLQKQTKKNYFDKVISNELQ